MSSLPSKQEALQLQKLRTLRVQRAREVLNKARAERVAAAAAVAELQQKIDAGKAALDEHSNAMVTTLVPGLPRWANLITAQRAKLLDRWERDSFAMHDELAALQQADKVVAEAEAELGRAMAREDISRDLVRDVRKAQVASADARAELELEDQGRPAATPGGER